MTSLNKSHVDIYIIFTISTLLCFYLCLSPRPGIFSVIFTRGREPLLKIGAMLPPFIALALCPCEAIDHMSWHFHSWGASNSWINTFCSGQFFTVSFLNLFQVIQYWFVKLRQFFLVKNVSVVGNSWPLLGPLDASENLWGSFVAYQYVQSQTLNSHCSRQKKPPPYECW